MVYTHGDDDCGADDGATDPAGLGPDMPLASAEDGHPLMDGDDMDAVVVGYDEDHGGERECAMALKTQLTVG